MHVERGAEGWSDQIKPGQMMLMKRNETRIHSLVHWDQDLDKAPFFVTINNTFFLEIYTLDNPPTDIYMSYTCICMHSPIVTTPV